MSTHRHHQRAARKLAAAGPLTYQQALLKLRRESASRTSGELAPMARLAELPVGLRQDPVVLDRFAPGLQSPHAAFIGPEDSGKTYLAQLEVARWARHGVPSLILDFFGEYAELCVALGGQALAFGGPGLALSPSSRATFNPMDFSLGLPAQPPADTLRQKIVAVQDLVVVLRELAGLPRASALSRHLLSGAISAAYERCGYLPGEPATFAGATAERMPTLAAVAENLATLSRSFKTPRRETLLAMSEEWLEVLARYVGDGELAGVFDRPTTITLDSTPMSVTIMSGHATERPALAHLALELARTALLAETSGQPRWMLYVEELQDFLDAPTETAFALQRIFRTARKCGVAATAIGQRAVAEGQSARAVQSLMSSCELSWSFGMGLGVDGQPRATPGFGEALLHVGAGDPLAVTLRGEMDRVERLAASGSARPAVP